MKTLALVALLIPFLLLATLIGSVITQAHHNAAAPTNTAFAVACGQHHACSSPVEPITTLPTVTVYADSASTANIDDTRSALTRWLNAIQTPATTSAPLTMPYYSFAAPSAVTANKG